MRIQLQSEGLAGEVVCVSYLLREKKCPYPAVFGGSRARTNLYFYLWWWWDKSVGSQKASGIRWRHRNADSVAVCLSHLWALLAAILQNSTTTSKPADKWKQWFNCLAHNNQQRLVILPWGLLCRSGEEENCLGQNWKLWQSTNCSKAWGESFQFSLHSGPLMIPSKKCSVEIFGIN